MPKMKSAYKFRIYPTRQQVTTLDQTLDSCRYLYNHSLAARRDSWDQGKNSLTYNQQAAKLKDKDEYQKKVFSQVLQDVLRRLDKAFKNFFRRVKAGENPGYPRFKGKGWL